MGAPAFAVSQNSSASVSGETTSAPASAPSRADVSAHQARRHHYVFAHRALPSWFFKHTDMLWERLSSDGSREIGELWKNVGEHLEETHRIPAAGLRVEKLDPVVGHDALLITLPEAARMAEAAFVLLLRKEGRLHYLTYELTVGPDLSFNADRAVLCAWNAQPSHFNYGLAGKVDRDVFLRLASAWLSDSSAKSAASFTPADPSPQPPKRP